MKLSMLEIFYGKKFNLSKATKQKFIREKFN